MICRRSLGKPGNQCLPRTIVKWSEPFDAFLVGSWIKNCCFSRSTSERRRLQVSLILNPDSSPIAIANWNRIFGPLNQRPDQLQVSRLVGARKPSDRGLDVKFGDNWIGRLPADPLHDLPIKEQRCCQRGRLTFSGLLRSSRNLEITLGTRIQGSSACGGETKRRLRLHLMSLNEL